MASFKVSGLAELRRQLVQQLPAEIKKEVQTSLEKSGEEMAAMARALAPVDDGDLQASIKVTTAGEMTPLYSSGGQQKVADLSVRVSAGNSSVRYAAIVEFGRKATDKAGAMAARPFFWPSYRALKKRFKGRTTRAINKALKKVGK